MNSPFEGFTDMTTTKPSDSGFKLTCNSCRMMVKSNEKLREAENFTCDRSLMSAKLQKLEKERKQAVLAVPKRNCGVKTKRQA